MAEKFDPGRTGLYAFEPTQPGGLLLYRKWDGTNWFWNEGSIEKSLASEIKFDNSKTLMQQLDTPAFLGWVCHLDGTPELQWPGQNQLELF